ncbi:MAG: PEP-CTERM sorting domain-containing protein [Bryobacteraceae bacterium]|nr:PEP-CTERM sorting domain-containing protein [Bryobacteraceae bacterium]
MRGHLTTLALLLALPALSFGNYDLGFSCIDDGAVDACVQNLAGQLKVNVQDTAGGAQFTFYNNVGIASSITDIYFDLPGLSTTNPKPETLLLFLSPNTPVITDSGAGVAFSAGADPGNLPRSTTPDPDFDTLYSADSDAPPSQNGVASSTEWVRFVFKYAATKDFDDVLSALEDGSLRIGLHVQSIGTAGRSDAYINDPFEPPQEVPEPGTYAALVGVGMGAFLWLQRRRKNAA